MLFISKKEGHYAVHGSFSAIAAIYLEPRFFPDLNFMCPNL